MSLLKLVGVSKIYQLDGVSVKAVEKASLEIKKGEFVAIMGPSGSGKSTLMHLAGCLDTPSSGKVYLKGKNISNLNEAELARIRNKEIGFVFQSFNLIPRIKAIDNVSLPLIYAGVNYENRIKRAIRALEKVGLKERIQHLPNQLSGGEQQRVAIARALINHPEIIFADEPTGNLDTKSGDQVMKILKDLNQKGHTIILVTHEQEIADFAQRTIKIRDGKIE
ncbi:MAG: ABC transporter ATP-binding protein [Candidatus Pacebacteria bacterium]|nr:ABC transporter ATP-binding protein [Candidatus Paceibacterota bacterium]